MYVPLGASELPPRRVPAAAVEAAPGPPDAILHVVAAAFLVVDGLALERGVLISVMRQTIGSCLRTPDVAIKGVSCSRGELFKRSRNCSSVLTAFRTSLSSL